jgi:hypothetical protein
MLKIQTKKLENFLNKCKMNGSQLIDDMLLKFERDGLRIAQDSKPNMVRVYGFLKREAFTEYEAIGTIGLSDINIIIKVIKTFPKELVLEKKSNVLEVIGGNKSVQIELVDETYIANIEGDVKFDKFVDVFEMNAEELSGILNDTILKIETTQGKVIFSNDGKYKFKRVLEVSTIVGGAKTKFGDPLLEAATNLEGTIKIRLGKDYPMILEETTEDGTMKFVVAPRVEEN